jgi:4-hydroxy-3-methylbut-2-enyl diphosphate reductase
VTQTTLSVSDTAAIVAALKARFPLIEGPHKDDICYATTNRQEAVRAIAPGADMILVVGAPNSSNSQRLKDVALKAGARDAMLIQDVEDIDWSRIGRPRVVGVTSGASAPEDLVQDVLKALAERFPTVIETVATSHEDVTFKLPSALRVA